MNLYNVDDERLTNLNITSHVIMNIEYFWTDERVRRLCEAIQNLDDIQINLDLFQPRSCTQITDQCFQYFGNLMPTNLLELSLNNWGNQNYNISDIAFIHLGKAFKNLKILRLNLQQWGHKGCKISNIGVVQLFKSLPQQIQELELNLNKLGYRNQNITGHSFVAMGDFIENLQNLKNLTLNLADWGNDYNRSLELFLNEDLQYLIEKIFNLDLEKLHLDLTGLGMNGSKITEESAFFLLQHLQQTDIYDLNIILQGWICNVEVKNQILKMTKEKQQQKKYMYQLLAIKSLDVSTQDRILEEIFAKL
ncbi:unnamed protein product [Paramecium pentaurelia]|uniref:Uncharacterized protein n=1 Tax=Paramecium pentaurelia TaxID=43138 RepID=A0A8S1TLZ0_9CILI|nr:unnamed protein product [Paramecium pentaurelia]